MKILSIETSCDDTGISILEMYGSFSARGGSALGGKVLANNSNSQIDIHIPYGGVYPVLAKREHARNLPLLLEKSLKQANLTPSPSSVKRGFGIDAIAVTYGPGLEMCLWEGITFAKSLAEKWNVPVIPINHMEGHIFSVLGKAKGTFKIKKLKTPILALLVSGGHTQLVLIKEKMSARGGSAFGGDDYEIIGETLDDAVGEAFDKVARMLDLPYPGGPQISKLAESLREKEEQFFRGVSQADGPRGSAPRARGDSDPEKIGFSFSLPRPMLHSKNFDFSFSGLKTAVLYLIRDLGGLKKINQNTKAQIALEFENAAIECLVYKTTQAAEKYKVKTILVAGGVSGNKHLKNEMEKIFSHARGRAGKKTCLPVGKVKLLFPPEGLSGDNSIMIGIAGYLNFIKNKNLPADKAGKVPKIENLKAIGNLRL